MRGICHEWFVSYLENGKLTVLLDKINCSKTTIACGIPQGSISDPTLFLIYVNSIANLNLQGE